MWYPGAVKKEIRPGENDPPIIPIGVILHTDAGNSASLFNYFNGPSGGIESHFHIPKKNPVEQYRDTGYEADANLKANSFYIDGIRYGFISVETQGLAGDPWTDYQLTEIKKLILWARSVHRNIELRVCPGPFSSGIGYHTLFGSPSPWTPVAKSCPGPVRIKQFNEVLVPWLKTAATPKPSTGGTMAIQDTPEYKGAYQANVDYNRLLFGEGGSMGEFIQRTDARLVDIINRLVRIEDDTDALQNPPALLAADGGSATFLATPAEQADGTV